MSKSILVTGGAGFIGSHLVDALVQQGHQVRVLDNLDPQVHGPLREEGKLPEYANPGAQYILGDVRDRNALEAALEGIEVVFHEAARVGVGQSMYEIEKYVDVNVRGTAILLDILANNSRIRSQVEKLIVASSMSIYGEGKYRCPQHGAVFPQLRPASQLALHDWEPRCPVVRGNGKTCDLPLEALATDENKPLYPSSVYAISKRDQEEMCLSIGRAYNLPTVALRYYNAYGRRQALSNPYTGIAAIFSNRLLAGKSPMIYEDGQQRRDLVHVSDLVQANLLVMENDQANYQAYNVGTGNSLSILDIAHVLCQQINSRIEPEIVNQFRAGDTRHCFPDMSRLCALGYAPKTNLEKGISELIEWVRLQKPGDHSADANQILLDRKLVG